MINNILESNELHYHYAFTLYKVINYFYLHLMFSIIGLLSTDAT